MEDFSPFELAIISRNYALSDSIFERERAFSRPFYHFTSAESSQKIIDSQQFKMSFLRSTSDPLELSWILALCRDYLCIGDDWDGKRFPKALFKHFNDEANDPVVRPYFISMTSNPNEAFLREHYGSSVIEFSADEEFVDPNGRFKMGFSILKCRYEADVKTFVETQIDRWNNEVLVPTLRDFGVKNHLLNVKEWHFNLMEFCFVLAMGVKSRSFFPEKEHRVIFIPRDPDTSCDFYSKRRLHPTENKFSRQREYLTLNLSKCGLKARHYNG